MSKLIGIGTLILVLLIWMGYRKIKLLTGWGGLVWLAEAGLPHWKEQSNEGRLL